MANLTHLWPNEGYSRTVFVNAVIILLSGELVLFSGLLEHLR